MDGKKVTLRDLALQAGLSVNTVSRALKDKEDIAAATRQMIKDLAKEMGYVGNALAGSLRSGLTKTIAVIVSDVANPHFGIMVKEIEKAARKHHYTIFVINTEDDHELEERAIYTAIGKNVDGILICPSQRSADTIRILKKNGVPFVLIGRRFEDEPEFDYVICDDEKGGYLAAKHLLESGHERVLYLNGPSRISSARERLAGFLRAYRETGLPVREDLIIEVEPTAGDTRKIVKQLIEQKADFTGIFAFNDVIAWEAVYVLQKYGYRVPGDYAVIGFDNIQSRMFLPFQLSSISNSKGKMSKRAVDILLHKINHPGAKESYRDVIDTALILRDSTKPSGRGDG
ncbi:LacI family DNA-binding transcriptional regulator [Paenibacillus sacheonensis]|uniref:Substrate-binding domain-containing protein n=1 Tax=Paenibacillus sacheonensis TaxID=742054 RepID=A0A7X5BX90_9BACL|nr:LacI family DNA-binding transcriptional regulator [Paenibacillus sacheonensis]MBM7564996.1 LacI family transcriptional regulator [Paenibacillus sacheonensis]NBC70218.1 substrate-binding domain-containing protein [Paenibacillus sacheonensis]